MLVEMLQSWTARSFTWTPLANRSSFRWSVAGHRSSSSHSMLSG